MPLGESLKTFVDENQSTQYDCPTLLSYSLLTGLLERRVSFSHEEDVKDRKSLRRKGRKKLKTLQHACSIQETNSEFRYKHPYETEILNLQYPEQVFQTREPIKYQPIESTTATYVDTYEGVLEMLEELKGATEIAIDTEHHDFRTYSGLLSLMQISTREKDWIIDILKPWRHKLEVLNEVFADPKIVKVRRSLIYFVQRLYTNHDSRSCKVLIWISSGSRGTVVYTSLDCLILMKQRYHWVIQDEGWPTCSSASSILMPTRSINWLTGGYGMTILRLSLFDGANL